VCSAVGAGNSNGVADQHVRSVPGLVRRKARRPCQPACPVHVSAVRHDCGVARLRLSVAGCLRPTSARPSTSTSRRRSAPSLPAPTRRCGSGCQVTGAGCSVTTRCAPPRGSAAAPPRICRSRSMTRSSTRSSLLDPSPRVLDAYTTLTGKAHVPRTVVVRVLAVEDLLHLRGGDACSGAAHAGRGSPVRRVAPRHLLVHTRLVADTSSSLPIVSPTPPVTSPSSPPWTGSSPDPTAASMTSGSATPPRLGRQPRGLHRLHQPRRGHLFTGQHHAGRQRITIDSPSTPFRSPNAPDPSSLSPPRCPRSERDPSTTSNSASAGTWRSIRARVWRWTSARRPPRRGSAEERAKDVLTCDASRYSCGLTN